MPESLTEWLFPALAGQQQLLEMICNSRATTARYECPGVEGGLSHDSPTPKLADHVS